MLKQVRGALKNVVAGFIAVLLVLAFAAWGVPELRTFTQRAPLRVGKITFSSQAITAEYNRQMAVRRQQAGGKFSQEEAKAAGLPSQVINMMATRSSLMQEAKKMGLAVPRSVVREQLQSDKRFQNPATGKFDEVTLRSILANNSLSVSEFENFIRDDILNDQLVGSISAGAPAPKPFANDLILREVERRLVGYLTITDEMAGVPAEPTPDDLKTYYNNHQSAFMAPEYRTFTVVEFKPDDFREGLTPPEEDLRKVYEANKARLYETPEKRTLYQITYDSQAQADAAAAALKEGKPFESLAADKNLTLDQVTFTEIPKADILDPSVAEAAFSKDLKEGGVVGPIKGLFGWTVVQLAGIKPSETKSYEDARSEIVDQYTEQDARKRMFDAVESVEEQRDTGASLKTAAEAAGAKTVQYGPVDSFSMAPGGVIVPDIPAGVLQEAFKLQEGDESEAVELPDNAGYFFVQVDEVRPAAIRPYENVEADVEKRWRAQERKTRIANAVKQITAAVAEGKTLEEAAKPFNRAVLEAVIERNTSTESFSPQLVRKAFLTDKGAVISGAAGSADAQTVLEIRQIGFARSKVTPADETAFRQYLGYQLNQELLEAYIDSLREEYGVHTDQNALAQIFNENQ